MTLCMIGCDYSQLIEWVAEGREKGTHDSISEQIPICIDSPAALAVRSRRWVDAGVDEGCHECVCVCLHCERYDLCRSKLHIGEEMKSLNHQQISFLSNTDFLCYNTCSLYILHLDTTRKFRRIRNHSCREDWAMITRPITRSHF